MCRWDVLTAAPFCQQGFQYVRGLIKTGIAKILSTASLSKKNPKVKPASSSLYLDGKQSWKLGLDTC